MNSTENDLALLNQFMNIMKTCISSIQGTYDVQCAVLNQQIESLNSQITNLQATVTDLNYQIAVLSSPAVNPDHEFSPALSLDQVTP